MDIAEVILATQGLNNVQFLGIIFVIYLVFKSKDFMLSLVDAKKRKKLAKNPCLTCPKPKIAADKAVKAFKLKHLDLVETQMELIERLAEKIKSILVLEFKRCGFSNKEQRYFRHVLNTAFEHVVDDLRDWVIKNNLTGRSETGFREYVEETVDETVENAYLHIDNYFIPEDFIKPFDSTVCLLEVKENIEDTLYELREISKTYELEIKFIGE